MSRFREGMHALSGAQKSKRGVSLYSRWVNRPLGRVFASAAYAVGWGPNAVTALSAAVTASGLVIVAVVPISLVSGLAAAILLILGFALDSSDGQVARLTGRSSAAGEWLDHVIDAGKMVAVHAAVLIGWARGGAVADLALLLPLLYQIVGVVLFAGMIIFELLQRAAGERGNATGAPSLARAVALLPADYGVLALSFVFWGAPTLFLPIYAVLLACTGAITAALLVKWFRALRA